MDRIPSSASRNWILAIATAVAFLAIAAGGWLSLRGLKAVQPAATSSRNSPVEPGETASIAAPKAAVPGRVPPEKFGLPSYPSASDFRSMVIDAERGSSAYLVTKGTSDEIVRFYIEKLGAAGWKYEWKRDASASPKDLGKALTLKGTRVRWVRRKDGRQLTLLALDDPQKGRTAQAVLNWSPLKKRSSGR